MVQSNGTIISQWLNASGFVTSSDFRTGGSYNIFLHSLKNETTGKVQKPLSFVLSACSRLKNTFTNSRWILWSVTLRRSRTTIRSTSCGCFLSTLFSQWVRSCSVSLPSPSHSPRWVSLYSCVPGQASPSLLSRPRTSCILFQAPASMKAVVQALLLLTTAGGDLIDLIVIPLNVYFVGDQVCTVDTKRISTEDPFFTNFTPGSRVPRFCWFDVHRYVPFGPRCKEVRVRRLHGRIYGHKRTRIDRRESK